MQVLRTVCVFALGVSLGIAAEQTKKSALDKPTLEAYVRQVELLPEQLKVTIGDPKPTLFPDFYEVPIEVSSPTGIFVMRYFVSKDGQKVVKGSMFDINKNPFEAEMKQVKTDL